MKKLILALAGLLFSLCSSAQMAQIWGTVKSEGFNDKDITLYAIKDGETKEIAKSNLAEDGSFGFMFNPSQEGFYAIGWGEFLRGKFPVYLKKGDKAEVAIYNRTIDFIGKQSPENAVLYKWMQMTESIRYNSFHSMQTHNQFFPALTELAAQADLFKKSINTKNAVFNESMKQTVAYDLDLYALNFLGVPRGGVFLKKEQLPPYYNTIVDSKKFNDCVLGMLHGKRFMDMYANFAIPGRGSLDQKITAFSNDHVKGAYILNSGRDMPNNYAAYRDFMNKYGKYFQTPYQKSVVEELGIKLYSSETGPKPAANFTYPDQHGKMVSLSDFKGKVVVVDVWATWCGPCKQQIPYLKKMEEAFKGKDVVFMSVSLDYEKDKQKWLDMLKELDLHGIQLFAGGWTKITKDYAISAIPRFMVFDKAGNVVSTDSPRPSDPKLKEILEKELSKELAKVN
ncbi:TlpA family protein disulfide reductase [Solitalea koreensis]|uniref:Thiol-disulfide isomerase or thioredoxin n=1 Tax=Solitalea koreensis TaxID=543615 RepID=A0A521AVI6_9SPHI|nr:TlpA disulfide reductase family protein [Solitalea koreensis]SMO38829.1 Thiol-disulfide isomerase or thioredoxin [Solitalea koreensis]